MCNYTVKNCSFSLATCSHQFEVIHSLTFAVFFVQNLAPLRCIFDHKHSWMIGVILCGGQSIRMGNDKGLIFSKDKAKVWAEIVRAKFPAIATPSFLSINQSQTKNYLHHFKESDLIVDNSNLKVRGPLLGLLSVHLKYTDQDLMVIACDMINMNETILKRLYDHYQSSKTEAIVFKGERVEPLCGIYSSEGLSKIYNAYSRNEMSNNSMMHALEKLDTSYISTPEEWKDHFKNFNNPKDLN